MSAYVYRHFGATLVSDSNWIGKLERGEITWPRGPQREAFRVILGVLTDGELGFVNQRRSELASTAIDPADVLEPGPDGGSANRPDLESASQILDRLSRMGPPVSDDYLDALDVFIEDVTDRYEMEGPWTLAPEVLTERRKVHELLMTSRPSRQGLRLMRSAGQLSGQLAYMAVNLGRFGSAGAYASEAFQLADEAGAPDLQAWVRGTQSFGSYYQGRYDEALAYAQEGLQLAGNGVQAVRLGINGEARALAQLQRRTEAEQSIGRAYKRLEKLTPGEGVSPCISFGLYSEARVVSNAATAYVTLGHTRDARRQIDRVLAVVDGSDSTWTKALVRLDAATAELKTARPKLDQAVDLVRRARDYTESSTLESISQRTNTCVGLLRRWRTEPVVAAFLDELEDEARASAGASQR